MKNRYLGLILLLLAFTSVIGQITNGTYRFNTLSTENNPQFFQVKASVNNTWSTQYDPSGNYPYQQHNETLGEDQVWVIEQVEKDYYKITSYITGKCLEARKIDNTDVQLLSTDYSNKDSQKWQFSRISNQTYTIISKMYGTVISIQGGDGAKTSGFLVVHEAQVIPVPGGSPSRMSQRINVSPYIVSTANPALQGSGLLATYNNGINLQGTTSLTRLDPNINITNFGSSNLPNGISINSNLSVKWEGKLESPFNGRINFFLKMDDGGRVFVDGKLIAERKNYEAAELIFSVNMIKGEKKDIRIEYFNYPNVGYIIWAWQYPGQAKQVVPSQYLYPVMNSSDIGISSSSPNKIIMIARDSTNKTKLRWIPPTAETWAKGNALGYKIERFTTKKDGIIKSTPYVKKEWVIKPQSQISSYWTNIMASNITKEYLSTYRGNVTYLSAMYQILYGKNDISLSHRYYTAVINTNLSFTAALAAGLGFVDEQALDTEEYIYKVSFVDPTSAIDPGEITVKTGTGVPVQPNVPKTQFLKKLVSQLNNSSNIIDRDSMLVKVNINTNSSKSYYGSYWIEKSSITTNNIFVKTTKLPLSNFTQMDSLVVYDTIPYHKTSIIKYRVVGRSYFDENWNSSEVAITYNPPMEFKPDIIKSRIVQDSTAYIKWQFPSNESFTSVDIQNIKARISGFKIEKSNLPNSNFTTLMDNIPVATDSTFLKENTTSNNKYYIRNDAIYVRVVALGKDGTKTYSESVMLQPIDNVPPQKPKIISAILSSDRKSVTLNWLQNTDVDLQGYFVYKKNFTGDLYWLNLTSQNITALTFKDTTLTNNSTDKLWYGLVAIDKRGNYSTFDSISVVKPDLVAPINPVFKSFQVFGDTVRLAWKIINYEDVKDYTLFRNAQVGCPINGWIMLKTFNRPQKDSTYIDKGLVNGSTYCYSLTAKDNANNSSTATPIIVKLNNLVDRSAIDSLNAIFVFDYKKIDLKWKYNSTSSDMVSFELARAEEPKAFSSWKVVERSAISITDYEVIFEKKYKYAIRAVFNDGTTSKWKSVDLTVPKGCKVGVYQIIRNTKITIFNNSVDKTCKEIILQPGFDSERMPYEASIDTTKYN